MSGNQTAVVEIRDLTVTFSRWGQTVTALNHVNLTIPSGQWVMLVGHNGSGKSTLLKAISGRLTPNGGQITLGGKQVTKMSSSEIAEHVFHVHQDPLMGTAPKLTLFENLMVADHKAQVEGTSRRELAHKYRELLQPLGLADRMKQLARYLSGGERQLIALLIARLRPASLLLLDEPLAALDPLKADLCMREVQALSQEGKTILQVTHDERLAVEAGHRTLAIQAGRIVYDEPVERRTLKAIVNHWHPIGDKVANEQNH
jgi:putative ABC transport system ATP-binding protein